MKNVASGTLKIRTNALMLVSLKFLKEKRECGAKRVLTGNFLTSGKLKPHELRKSAHYGERAHLNFFSLLLFTWPKIHSYRER